jgi:hypothetical protein
MAGRKVCSEREALQCLAAAQRAGVVPGEWASSNGIDGRSLNAWRVNLARRGVSRPSVGPKLIELVPAAAASATSSARYVLHVGGVELELGDDFDEQSVRRLVGLLRSC